MIIDVFEGKNDNKALRDMIWKAYLCIYWTQAGESRYARENNENFSPKLENNQRIKNVIHAKFENAKVLTCEGVL